MAAESRRAAALDGRHDLQLAEAHVTGVGSAPRRSVAAEDIRDLQRRTRHGRRGSAGRLTVLEVRSETLQWAHDLADRLGGNAGVERRGIELGVSKQDLDHTDIDVLLEQMRGKAVPQRMRRYPLVDPGHVGGRVAGAIELACGERIDPVLPGK